VQNVFRCEKAAMTLATETERHDAVADQPPKGVTEETSASVGRGGDFWFLLTIGAVATAEVAALLVLL
jgi:hypothetical protein